MCKKSDVKRIIVDSVALKKIEKMRIGHPHTKCIVNVDGMYFLSPANFMTTVLPEGIGIISPV